MSNFNLERAKAGEPIVTCDKNIPVKLICWNRRVGEYIYIVYLELTAYTDRIRSVPIGDAGFYLKMMEE